VQAFSTRLIFLQTNRFQTTKIIAYYVDAMNNNYDPRHAILYSIIVCQQTDTFFLIQIGKTLYIVAMPQCLS